MAGGILKTGLLDHSIPINRLSASPSSSLNSNSLSVSCSQFGPLCGLGGSCASWSHRYCPLSPSVRGCPLQARSAQQQSTCGAFSRSATPSLRLRRPGRRRVCVSCSSGEQPATVSVSNGWYAFSLADVEENVERLKHCPSILFSNSVKNDSWRIQSLSWPPWRLAS